MRVYFLLCVLRDLCVELPSTIRTLTILSPRTAGGIPLIPSIVGMLGP